jgi:hypothetical protein
MGRNFRRLSKGGGLLQDGFCGVKPQNTSHLPLQKPQASFGIGMDYQIGIAMQTLFLEAGMTCSQI